MFPKVFTMISLKAILIMATVYQTDYSNAETKTTIFQEYCSISIVGKEL